MLSNIVCFSFSWQQLMALWLPPWYPLRTLNPPIAAAGVSSSVSGPPAASPTGSAVMDTPTVRMALMKHTAVSICTMHLQNTVSQTHRTRTTEEQSYNWRRFKWRRQSKGLLAGLRRVFSHSLPHEFKPVRRSVGLFRGCRVILSVEYRSFVSILPPTKAPWDNVRAELNHFWSFHRCDIKQEVGAKVLCNGIFKLCCDNNLRRSYFMSGLRVYWTESRKLPEQNTCPLSTYLYVRCAYKDLNGYVLNGKMDKIGIFSLTFH